MIRIITDSTCEAPEEVIGHPRVQTVPLSVVFGNEALLDGVEISRDQFWERLPKASALPTTSQATPADFTTHFQRYTEAGDEVIVIVLSSKLSGTYESAMIAREAFPGQPIDVVDSHTISVGLGLIVAKAIRLAEAGLSREAIVAQLNEMREHVHIMFAVDTLEYLQKGGRIGKAQAFVGTLLQFKPLLALEKGEVEPLTRVRTRSKAWEKLLELLKQRVPQRGPEVQLAVTQAGIPREAEELSKALSREFQSPNIYISTIGPVIGTHTGPGVIGAAVYYDPWTKS